MMLGGVFTPRQKQIWLYVSDPPLKVETVKNPTKQLQQLNAKFTLMHHSVIVTALTAFTFNTLIILFVTNHFQFCNRVLTQCGVSTFTEGRDVNNSPPVVLKHSNYNNSH